MEPPKKQLIMWLFLIINELKIKNNETKNKDNNIKNNGIRIEKKDNNNNEGNDQCIEKKLRWQQIGQPSNRFAVPLSDPFAIIKHPLENTLLYKWCIHVYTYTARYFVLLINSISYLKQLKIIFYEIILFLY